MTWRRFAVLLRNLSAGSTWHALARAEGSKPRVITDADEAQRYFDRI